MCFQLYVGTLQPIPRVPWDKDAPAISVQDVLESEKSIFEYFSSPHVQFIGSTCGCGCDFPYITEQRGEWPWWEGLALEPEQQTIEELNRRRIADLLRSTDEEWIELYGIWMGGSSIRPPSIREEIDLDRLTDPTFRFKENGFLRVHNSAASKLL
jgi:hypothetical protein